MDIQSQKGAEESKPQTKIEVTPEMIEAGWPILDAYDPDYSSSEKCLRDIFAAMEVARISSTELV